MTSAQQLPALAGALLVCLCVAGCSEPSPQAAAPTASIAVDRDPHAPFHVRVSRRGELPTGALTPLTLSIRPEPGVRSWRSSVRGIRGIRVEDGGRQDHGRSPVSRTVRVRADAGVAGFIAIDLAWQSEGGGSGSTSLAVPLRAAGTPIPTPALGRVEKGPRGEAVQVMPAD